MAGAEHEKELHGWFYPTKKLQSVAHVNSMDQYKEMYKKSIEDPEGFWKEIAKEFYWKSPPNGEFMTYNFDTREGQVYVKWMQGAVTNICYNLLDRHVKDKGLGDRVAFYWEGNEPDDTKQITYGELLKEVCKFSNVLISKGVKKGDRVAIYMPMIIELVVAMLACVRIGAIHSIVLFMEKCNVDKLLWEERIKGRFYEHVLIKFGGFSAESLAERILDASCSLLITADGSYRGKKLVALKEISDSALEKCRENGHEVVTCIVVKHLGTSSAENGSVGSSPTPKRQCLDFKANFNPSVDCWWHELMAMASDECECEWMDAEDPLFMLYTSGSTGKPKGVLHTTAGYMIWAATTFKYSFDYHPGDVYWCTADIGWITGHSYITYGPMAQGATSVLFEGTPFYPKPDRFWEIVDKYNVVSFYTAPTAIRSLMKFGKEIVQRHDMKELRVLGTVGEPINPEAWLWYYHVVGHDRCSISDTYWQTETGGHMLTPMPGATPMRPGSTTFPFFGVVPAIVDDEGRELEGVCEGHLVIKKPWPGMFRTLYGAHQRYEDVYFNKFKGYYCTGDGARRDEKGYYWVTGRTDDCMNVAGHLLSTAQIENALVEHDSVTEAAVVSCPHKEKGEGIYCFVTLMDDIVMTEALVRELKQIVRLKIGPFATPDIIQSAPGLPKTRSGKIMRRVLRQIAKNERDFGDLTTIYDPTVVDQLLANRPHVDFLIK